jgi:hypothetical protein
MQCLSIVRDIEEDHDKESTPTIPKNQPFMYSSITYLLHGVRILSILNILRFAMINNQAAHFFVTVNAPAMSSPASPCSAVVGLGRACLVDLPEWEVFSWEARCAHSDHINAGRWVWKQGTPF